MAGGRRTRLLRAPRERNKSARRRDETSGAKHAHEIAPGNTRGFPRFEEERVLAGMLVQPVRLLHRLHELAKERSATVRHLVGAATAKIVQPARLRLQQKTTSSRFARLTPTGIHPDHKTTDPYVASRDLPDRSPRPDLPPRS